ncbi:MAG: MFS transporter [bacterium]|nr:MFS transporter [bacterium]
MKFFLPINKIIKVLILSDFIIASAFGLVAPIFALFLTDKIQGGTIETVGFAMAFYWVAVVLTRLPIARYVDRTESEKDDFYFMILGSILISIVPFLFLASSKIWHIYLIQMFYGLGYSLRLPGWYGMFTRHIDKGQEGYDWSMDTVLAGAGSAVTAALGGVLAARLGFEILFMFIGIMAIFGSAVLIFLYYIVAPNHGSKKEEKELSIDGHEKK